MGDSFSKISGHIKEYEELCELYGEKVRYNRFFSPDCYGDHCRELKARRTEDAPVYWVMES